MRKVIFNPQRDNINDVINSQPGFTFVGARKFAENKAVALFSPPTIALPDYVYEAPESEARVEEEGEQWAAERYECSPDEDGIRFYLKDAEYPMKSFVDGDTMKVINIAKKLLMEPVKLSPFLIPSILTIAVSPLKFLDKAITSYNTIAIRIVGIYTDRPQLLLKQKYLSPMAAELKWFIFNFLKELVKEEEAMKFAKIFANIINYDNAYYLRFSDLFNETEQSELYENPVREVRRLLLINNSREKTHPQVKLKFRLFANIVSLAFLHPKIKKAFRAAVREADFEKLKPDEIDKYWMALRTDYDFFGKGKEERRQEISHLKVPKPVQT